MIISGLGETDTYSVVELTEAIDARKDWISIIQQWLPYADHGAYGQDMESINRYREEINQIKQCINKRV